MIVYGALAVTVTAQPLLYVTLAEPSATVTMSPAPAPKLESAGMVLPLTWAEPEITCTCTVPLERTRALGCCAKALPTAKVATRATISFFILFSPGLRNTCGLSHVRTGE